MCISYISRFAWRCVHLEPHSFLVLPTYSRALSSCLTRSFHTDHFHTIPFVNCSFCLCDTLQGKDGELSSVQLLFLGAWTQRRAHTPSPHFTQHTLTNQNQGFKPASSVKTLQLGKLKGSQGDELDEMGWLALCSQLYWQRCSTGLLFSCTNLWLVRKGVSDGRRSGSRISKEHLQCGVC